MNADAYGDALKGDPIKKVQSFVAAVRASGQRRETFMRIIHEGNLAGGFGNPSKLLRLVGLLKDMVIRWSSTFKMVDRFLEQHPVFVYSSCSKFLKESDLPIVLGMPTLYKSRLGSGA